VLSGFAGGKEISRQDAKLQRNSKKGNGNLTQTRRVGKRRLFLPFVNGYDKMEFLLHTPIFGVTTHNGWTK